MKRAIISSCVALFIATLMSTGFQSKNARAERGNLRTAPVEQIVPGRVLVKFRDGIVFERGQQVIAGLGARDAEQIANIGVHVLELPFQANEAAFAHAFQERPEVEFAELDRILEPDDMTPNDPSYPSQWHLSKIA